MSTTVSVESASPSPGVHPIAPPTSCQLKPSTMAKGAKYKASDESTAAEAAADAALAASEETLKHGAEAAAEVSEKAEGLLSKIGSAAKAVAREVAMIDDTPSKKKNPFSGKKAEGETEAEANEEVDPEAAEAAATLQATLEASASMEAKRAARMMTPEEKQAAETEAKAQEIQTASEYEELMSDRLPGVNPKLDFNEAKDRWKEAAVTDINGQYISVCGSGYNDLEPLGPGIGLWFRTLKSLALYFTLMTLLVGLVIYNFIYLYYNPESDMDEDTMGALARVTAGVMATTDQTDSIGGIDIRTIMLVVVSIDVFCILCFLIMIAHLKRRQDRYVEENDDAVVSLPDYSVMVWGIPTDATEEQLVAHFSKFGQLADVVLVKDLGRVMAPRMRRATQLDYLKDLKIDAAAMTLKHRVRALKVQTRRIERYQKRVAKTNDKIEKALEKGFAAVCAFITFTEPESRAVCVDAYNEQWSCCHAETLKFGGKHQLKIKPAPEASDVMWENVLRKNPLVQLTRKLISFTVILILCAAAVGVMVYAKDAASNAAPAVSCATVTPSDLNPNPNLHCAAIWDLNGEDAYNVPTSQARVAIDKFVANVDLEKCRNFISGADWILPLGDYSANNYSVAQNAALPALAADWTGGFIPESNADECAALTCKKCFCVGQVDIQQVLRDYAFGETTESGNFCKSIYDQMALEVSVLIGTILMTTATNMILMSSAQVFSQFERHKTISATETNCAKYTFAALLVNQAIVPVVIYSFIDALEGFPVLFQGQYGDFESAWYNKVMVTIISTAMVNIVAFPLGAAIPNIQASMSRALFGCCAHSQKKLNAIYVPAEFSLAKRYGQMLCGLFYSIIFLCAAPPLAPAAAVLFSAMYITDKWLLLKFSKRPPMYDHKLNAFFLQTAPYAAWIHLAIATWAFGYYEIPSYIVDPGGLAGSVGVNSKSVTSATATSDTDLTGAPDQFDFMARVVRLNALVPFLMFVVVTVALFFARIVDTVVGTLGAACAGEEKIDEVPPFDELIFFGDSRYEDELVEGELNNKLSGLRSYRLEDNPKYMKLFPEVLAADGTNKASAKRNASAPPKAQTMA